jgi:hypothetical protein
LLRGVGRGRGGRVLGMRLAAGRGVGEGEREGQGLMSEWGLGERLGGGVFGIALRSVYLGLMSVV